MKAYGINAMWVKYYKILCKKKLTQVLLGIELKIGVELSHGTFKFIYFALRHSLSLFSLNNYKKNAQLNNLVNGPWW